MIRNFSVPDPCHEQWDGMKPQENGRYCGSCQKVVIDFTNKTEQEIIDHFTANAGKKMCGTFKNSQLTPPDSYQHHERSIRFLAALLLVFGMSLFSCHSIAFEKGTGDAEQKQELQVLTGIVIPPPIIHDTLTKVDPPWVKGDIKVCNKTDSYERTMGVPNINHDTIKVRKPIIVCNADQMPEFTYGGRSLFEYISINLKYPKIAIDSAVQGTVYVAFVVKTDGSINDVKILRGISPECDAEALKVVKEMPPWKPGKNNGQVVNVQYNLPIKFTLR